MKFDQSRQVNFPVKNKKIKEHTIKKYVECGDCRQTLKVLPDNIASLILTDPPYFIDGMDDQWDHNKLRSRIKNGVIGSLPVGMRFDPEQGKRLYAFLLPIAQEWLRILKPGGFVLCFSQARLVHRTALAIEDACFEIRDLLAWRYEGQGKAFSQDHFIRKSKLSYSEKQKQIIALEGRKTPQLKPQMENIILAQAPRDGTYVNNYLKYKVGLIDLKKPLLNAGRCPGTVIEAKKPRERYGHLTAKPVDLLRHLIRIFTAKGTESLVIDPFAGSGSTGVAALMEGRGFIGYEIDKAMSQIADKRIKDIQKNRQNICRD